MKRIRKVGSRVKSATRLAGRVAKAFVTRPFTNSDVKSVRKGPRY